ncbi:hypothetical protein M8C13_04350 [Crossiella sp. SN42]|uniref:hypothetical protein n=1 Tax=Crossiella sp. SN42 TaxID=2944808 RepID=UPI00207C181A|nr:hypothetical protein [Crossiella sp. SN42]MCO1574989.1 hypothetical protein [Crossiella sp. SN42]
MNRSITLLRDLADHVDQHRLAEHEVLSAGVDLNGLRVHVRRPQDKSMPSLLRWHDTLAAPSLTAQVVGESVHLHAHGLLGNTKTQIVAVIADDTADLLRANFTLTDKPTQVPVHKLRRLVDAEALMRQPLMELPGADVPPMRTTVDGAR